MAAWFDVRDFDAVGDGTVLDSPAVQRAVDACAAAGGGMVRVGPGRYRCGTVELKDNVELHLAPGACLVASTNPADYPQRFAIPRWVPSEKLNVDQHLILADGRRNVAVTGAGCIDGNCGAFMIPHPEKPEKGLTVKDWRPGQLLHFHRCRGVRVCDVRIVDSPSWTVWLQGCRDVRVSGMAITNIRHSANTDGIGICGCRDVVVSDCVIAAGDDCITLYGNHFDPDDTDCVCENIAVTNCVLSTRCCGVRIGYTSDCTIRNAVFSNLTMPDVAIGVDMIPNRFTPMSGIEPTHGPRIEGMRFQNLLINATRAAFHLWIHDKCTAPAGIVDVAFAGITARAGAGCHITGTPRIPIENIRVSGLHLTLTGAADTRFAAAVPYPLSCWASAAPVPHGIFIRHARDIQLHDVTVAWKQASGPWQNAVRAEQVDGLDIDGLRAAPGAGAGAAAVFMRDCRDVSLRHSVALKGTETFLALAGTETTDVRQTGNDLHHAKTPITLAEDVP